MKDYGSFLDEEMSEEVESDEESGSTVSQISELLGVPENKRARFESLLHDYIMECFSEE